MPATEPDATEIAAPSAAVVAEPVVATLAAPRGIAVRLPALASPVFRRFLAAAMVGSVGAQMQAAAQGWLVLDLTDSSAALGVVSAIQWTPILVLSAAAGVMADRMDRRRVLVSTQLVAASLAVVLAALTTTDAVRFEHVAVIALLAGAVSAVQSPAYQAIVSTLVDRAAIGSAVALNSAQFNLSRILGPSIAGAVIAAGGLELAFWGNAAALLLVAAILLTLRVVAAPAAEAARAQASMWTNLVDGLRYVRSRRVIAVLVLLAGVPALALLNYLVLLPVFARDVLAIGAPGLGLLSAGIGVGALTGAIGLAVYRPSGGSGRGLLIGLAVASVAEMVFASSRSVPLSVAALAVLGGCQVLYYATTNTLLQLLVPARLRGRVMSLYILTSLGLIPIGNVVSGIIAERAGATVALVAGGVVTLAVVVVVAVAVPELRRLQGVEASGDGAGEGSA